MFKVSTFCKIENMALEELKIYNFGPLKRVSVKINKYTIFIGNQGTGKSTIAKLYSMFVWLEKSLIRGDISKAECQKKSKFKTYCKYHRIDTYLQKNTQIFYSNEYYDIEYSNARLKIVEKQFNEQIIYRLPKIMYVPAERSFLNVAEQARTLKGLPPALDTFLTEYENAKVFFKSGMDLPWNDSRFEYDVQNKISYIIGIDYKIRLHQASSGYHSALPLLLVSAYLNKLVDSKDGVELTNEDRRRIQKMFMSLIDENIPEKIRTEYIATISSKYKYSSFINVVEEPEVNLYPASQRNILYKLLEYAYRDGSKLLITTHSPYLIGYIGLACKAFKIKDIAPPEKISKIIPRSAWINPQHVTIYQTTDNDVKKLPMEYGMPSDKNFLNEELGKFNEQLAKLIDIEE